HGSPTRRLDAGPLVGHALGLPRSELYPNFDRPRDEPELAACRALLERRGRREPVAYILGRWGFHGLDLAVDGRVLVPRPETEVLVERCLVLLDGREAPRLVDVGTGSGAIALAVKAARPDAAVRGGRARRGGPRPGRWGGGRGGARRDGRRAGAGGRGGGGRPVGGGGGALRRGRVDPAVHRRGGDGRARARGDRVRAAPGDG